MVFIFQKLGQLHRILAIHLRVVVMLFAIRELALARLDILEILTQVVALNAVLMASVHRLVRAKEENVLIHAQVHAERMRYVQSITMFHRARVLLAPQEILSIYVVKFKSKKVEYL